MRTAGLCASMAIVLVGLLPAPGLARTVACGEVITQDTAVDNDLLCTQSTGLVIGASGVTLNLRGHVIRTAATPPQGGFTAIDSQGHTDVTIRNGRAEGSGLLPGIWAVGARVRIVDVAALGRFAFTVTGDDNVLRRVSGPSAALAGARATLTDSSGLFVVASGTGHRIAHNDLSAAFLEGDDVTLSDNHVVRVTVQGDRNRIVRNRGVTSLALGEANDNRVAHNEVGGRNEFGDVPGISVGIEAPAARNEVVDNTVSRVAETFFSGIWVGADATETRVVRNFSVANPGDGILIEAPATLVRRNDAHFNGQLGIRAVIGVTDGGGNRAAGNGDPRECVGIACR
jgi:Right handed beta helix region